MSGFADSVRWAWRRDGLFGAMAMIWVLLARRFHLRPESDTQEAQEEPMGARFEVYKDKRGGWRWRLRAANGRIVATGEAHTRKADAVRAAANLPGIADEADREVRQVGR